MLRDRLVSGVNNEKIQRCLLSEGELAFKKAFEIALSLEMAAQHKADMHLIPSTLVNSSASVGKVSFSKKQPHKNGPNECYRCGKDHNPSKCRLKDSTCYYCKKKGHIIAKCLKKQGNQHILQTPLQANKVNREFMLWVLNSQMRNRIFTHCCPTGQQNPYMVTVELNGLEVKMEVDTGASLSVIGENVYNQLNNIEGSPLKLQDTKLTLKSYTGEIIPVLGKLSVEVKYKDFCEHLSVIVVKGQVPSLFGRDWMQHVKLSWSEIFHLSELSPDVSSLFGEHEALFKEELGTVQGVKAKIHVDSQAKPKYFKPRPVAYALRQKVGRNWIACYLKGQFVLLSFLNGVLQ